MARARTILFLFSILLVVLVGEAVQAPNTDDLILVPVTVSDSKDVPVSTLKEEHFQVLEDNKEQKIVYFSPATDPIAVGVVLGLSARGPVKAQGQKDRISTDITNAVERAREANAGGPGPVIQSPLDSDGLLGTVAQALTSIGRQPGAKKALVVVNDGFNTSGTSSTIAVPTALIEAAKVSRFPIHYLLVVEKLPEPALTESSINATGYYLKEAADYSGGEMVVGQIENNLTKVSTNLRDALKNQYVLGFKSMNTAKDGKWRKLSVKVTPPAGTAKVKVKTKSRYFVAKG